MKKIRYLAIISISLVFIVGFSGAVMAEWTAEELRNAIDEGTYNMGPEDVEFVIYNETEDRYYYYQDMDDDNELYFEFEIDYEEGQFEDLKTAIEQHLELSDNVMNVDNVIEDDEVVKIEVSITEDLTDGDDYQLLVNEEEIGEFRADSVPTWDGARLADRIISADMGPRASITPLEGNLYEYRRTGDGIYLILEIDYQPAEILEVKRVLNAELGMAPSGEADPGEGFNIEDDHINELFHGTIEVNIGGPMHLRSMNTEYDIFLEEDRFNEILARVEWVSLYPSPRVRAELDNHPELGELRPDQLYYVNPEESDGSLGMLRPIITAASTYNLNYRLGGAPFTRAGFEGDEDVDLGDADVNFGDLDPHQNDHWLSRDGFANFNQALNLDYADEHDLDRDVEHGLGPDQDPYIIAPEIFNDYNVPTDADFHAVVFNVDARGVRYPELATFYFVRDEDAPRIRPGLLDEEGVFSGEYGNFDSITEEDFAFGVSNTGNPQLNLKLKDRLAGVESTDDLTVKYMSIGEEEDITYDNFMDEKSYAPFEEHGFDGYMNVISLDNRADTRAEGEQIATITPYSTLAEGEYLIKVSATDLAGNNSKDVIDEKYIFHLEVDASQPEAYNFRLNHPSMIEEITGTDALDFRFDAVGIEDVVYGINYLEDDTETWVLAADRNLDLSRRRNKGRDFSEGDYYFIDDNGLAKDGEYEIRVIGDEEEIPQLDNIDMDNINEELDFEELLAEEEVMREGRRDYQGFRFVVDGNPPAYDYRDIRYITGTGDRVEPEDGADSYNYTITPPESDLVNQGSGSATNFGVLYTDMPTFEMKFENLSEVRVDDIRVRMGPDDDERLARVVGLEEDDSGELNQYTVEIEPRRGLNDANHNLIIEVEDIHGNSSKIRYNNLFETSHIDGRIDFNVPEGRSTINEGSAFEIYLPDDLDTDTLRVAVDDELIVSSGDIVGEGDAETRSDDYYQNEDYYKDDDYKAEGFDVMFFDNKRRILVFIRMPITGKVEVAVDVENRYGDITTDTASFRVDNYRDGFGFGRLLIIDED